MTTEGDLKINIRLLRGYSDRIGWRWGMKSPLLSLIALFASTGIYSQDSASARAQFYRSPQLFVMTGFIANTGTGVWGADYIVNGPWTREKQQAALESWNKGLGSAYDAERAVATFKNAGATGVIFYDKWHDGNVPHSTKLTGFHTERDLLGLTLKALHSQNMKAVVYYSVGLDANPEPRFLDWTCLDPKRKPMGMAFENDWKSFYSPYRMYALDQMVEILKNYGPLDGFYLDLFAQPVGSRDKYTDAAFQAKYGKPVGEGSEEELQEFKVQTLSDYLLELRRKLSAVQPDIGLTWNGAGMGDIVNPREAKWVDSSVDWFSMEGHSWPNIDQGARLGHASDRPFDVGILLSSSWYVPVSDQAPPPAMSEDEARVSAATAWIQGGNVYAALTPGHSGIFDENGDLRVLRAIGSWLRDNKE
ncbi:MAG TPA: alpha-L-fucosidase [Terriglobia bacterium]|nr:alpha-L-fucosidase [Terriglobia bacterium]